MTVSTQAAVENSASSIWLEESSRLRSRQSTIKNFHYYPLLEWLGHHDLIGSHVTKLYDLDIATKLGINKVVPLCGFTAMGKSGSFLALRNLGFENASDEISRARDDFIHCSFCSTEHSAHERFFVALTSQLCPCTI